MCNPSSETLRVGEKRWKRLLLVAVCACSFVFVGKYERRYVKLECDYVHKF